MTVINAVRKSFKENGIRATVRQMGWKLVAMIFAYYIVRDSILYLLIPFLVKTYWL